MNKELLLAHILIFLISVFGFTSLYEYIGNGTFEIIYAIFHFIIISALYVLSGFMATEETKKYNLKNYYIIALIGTIIWLIAFLSSPTDLNYKSSNSAGFWFIYQLYISGIETPFNFNDSFTIWTKSISLNMGILLILTFVPSLFQAYGGFLQTNRNKKTLHNKRL